MIGAICAAGWKGYVQAALGKAEWGIKLPEALIPIGDETILSRTVRQLRETGATEIFIGIGVPSKSSPIYEDWLQRIHGYKIEVGAEVWTQERIEYVNSLGCVTVPMPDFDYTPASYTVARLLEAISKSGKDFDIILVTMGDYVMARSAWDTILGLPVPCLWLPTSHHQGWLVDKAAAEFLSEWLLVSGSKLDRNPWFNHLWDNVEVLEEQGIEVMENIFPGAPRFIEIDGPDAYRLAKRMVGVK